MKNIVLTFAIVLFSLSLIASEGSENKMVSTTFAGTVIDNESGEALVGVAVKLNNQTVFTDFDGNFSFENVVPGTYEIETSYVSYQDNKMNIKIEQEQEVKIKLKSE